MTGREARACCFMSVCENIFNSEASCKSGKKLVGEMGRLRRTVNNGQGTRVLKMRWTFCVWRKQRDMVEDKSWRDQYITVKILLRMRWALLEISKQQCYVIWLPFEIQQRERVMQRNQQGSHCNSPGGTVMVWARVLPLRKRFKMPDFCFI